MKITKAWAAISPLTISTYDNDKSKLSAEAFDVLKGALLTVTAEMPLPSGMLNTTEERYNAVSSLIRERLLVVKIRLNKKKRRIDVKWAVKGPSAMSGVLSRVKH